MVVSLIIFPLGLYLCWLLHRRATLVTPIVAHAVFNLLGVAGLATGSPLEPERALQRGRAAR